METNKRKDYRLRKYSSRDCLDLDYVPVSKEPAEDSKESHPSGWPHSCVHMFFHNPAPALLQVWADYSLKSPGKESLARSLNINLASSARSQSGYVSMTFS